MFHKYVKERVVIPMVNGLSCLGVLVMFLLIKLYRLTANGPNKNSGTGGREPLNSCIFMYRDVSLAKSYRALTLWRHDRDVNHENIVLYCGQSFKRESSLEKVKVASLW